jgi:RNA polymerase sigma factor for flagellar operon FliA
MATSPVSSTPIPVFFGTIPLSAWQQEEIDGAEIEIGGDRPVVALNPSTDSATREQILLEHMSLVRFVARKIHERLPQHVELDDLIGAGIVGLIDAFNKFDHKKEVQFRSYAQFRIRGAILDSLRSLDWGSRDLRRKGRDIEEATQRLIHQLNRKPTESEIAVALRMSLGQYQQLLGNLKNLEIGSLNEQHSEDSAEEEVAYVPTSPEKDPLFLCLKSEMSAQLSAAVKTLPEREARVLTLYYVEEMTLKQIGAVLGLAESRISQIRAGALVELRVRLQATTKRVHVQPINRSRRSRSHIPAALTERAAATDHAGRAQRLAV